MTRTRASEPSTPWSPGPAPPPDRVGNYVLRRKLGEGGMGVVYAAHHAALDRLVALKLVHERSRGRDGPGWMLREAQALARLSHPNVVQVHEVGEHMGQVFVAMEYVEGETLDAWQQRPGRTLAEILRAYREAAIGLRAAHAVGLVHRDFKPTNAIVGVDGRVRVLDFGLAHGARAATIDGAGGGALGETAVGSIVGTPAYMSPEQFAGLPVDARSDVFSLSVALWEAIHGVRPFVGETVDELREGVLRGQRRPPTPGVRIPDRLSALLERGLEPDRERRLDALDPLIDALAADPDADPTAASRERRIFFMVVGAALLLVVTPLMILGAVDETVDRRVLGAIVGVVALAMLSAVGIAFRRTLLGNAYHRRMVLFLVANLVVITSQRIFAIADDSPYDAMTTGSAHILIGMSVTGAIFFARWMLVLAATIVGLLIAVYCVHALDGVAVVLAGPLYIFAFVYFWHRDARRDR